MIFEIAIGIVCGFLLLVAIVMFAGALFVVISKSITINRVKTKKRYDFDEEDDERDEYDR